MEYMDTGFEKLTSILNSLVIEMNRYLQETDILESMTKGKTIVIQKDTSLPNNYRTHNVPTDDQESIHSMPLGRIYTIR